MFYTIEKYSGLAKVIIGLIALTFVGFGVNSVAFGESDYITKVGDQKISREQIDQALRNLQNSGNAGVAPASIYQSLLQHAYLIEGARLMGIGVSMETLKKNIAHAPIFQENGQFSQVKFNEYLKQIGISEDQLVEQERDALALETLENLSRDGAIVSDAQAKQIVSILNAARIVRMTTINPEAFLAKVSLDDATLKSYYEANKKNYILPQAVKFQYIALAPEDLIGKQTVSEAELKEAYEKSANDGKPRRSVQHILIPLGNSDEEKEANKKLAEKVAAEAKARPESFGELAKQYSSDAATVGNGGNLGFIQKGGQLPKAFEDAVFAMEQGKVSGPVQVDYGYHIIKLNEIRDKPNFEQDRALLAEEIKLKKAQQAMIKAREELETAAFDNPTDLAKVAEKMGVKLNTIGQWVTKAEAERETEKMGSPEMAKTLFSEESLKSKHNSEPITVGNGVITVVRVTDVRQETTESFEAAKEKVKSAYLASQARKLALDQAKQTLADLKTGEKVDVQWSPVQKLTRAEAGRVLGPEEVNALLKAKPQKDKPVYVLAENLPQPVLIEVQGIEEPENIEAQMPQARAALVQSMNINIYDAFLRYLQREIKQKNGSQKLSSESETS
ncbi:peptidylprolyl isomerase [Neisseria wadsworthii]|uniref:Periplasmic chaperone PpiD n=1 Tax=Neisseria wadsworthii 9715 TaxID=1030841 RepID=G4CQ30_9NEIS|nr:peptidylprolyl isomerase [Neisseria wadsworthii]EGZ47150.1 peptidyl-prolyl cis-trans isomerase [Neisseria wadsworthii 9715]QMT34963.1 SurA N-terminal domain-containing protein [Neisseria wadsworthii]